MLKTYQTATISTQGFSICYDKHSSFRTDLKELQTLFKLTAFTMARTNLTTSLSVSAGKLFAISRNISLSTNTAVSTCTGALIERRCRPHCFWGSVASAWAPQKDDVSDSRNSLWRWSMCFRTMIWGGGSGERLLNLFGSGFIT